jgi:alkylhydroperoxidase family enzyme
MPRIRLLELDEMTPEARALVQDKEGRGIPGNARIQAHQPAMARAWDELGVVIATQGTLSPRLLELVRLRIAFHNQCRTCMALRYLPEEEIDEGTVCSLERPQEADDLSEAERCALRFADLFATNHLAIDDKMYDELREYFTEAELVQLGYRCAVNLAVGRLAATWDTVEGLPERFHGERDYGAMTPGGGDVIRVNAVAASNV